MTRPQIIRADTLDLQDTTSPTAQDHSRQPQHPAPLGAGPAAPHQEASLRQVTAEQSSEQSQLRQSTWSNDATMLREDPGSDDERTVINGDEHLPRDETAVRLNGGMTTTADDGDMADAEADDLDDDMMDRISSSPSIDDGGYSLPLTPWPVRASSLPGSSLNSPVSPMSPIDSSSPFTATPLHLPLSSATAGRPRNYVTAEQGPVSPSPLTSPISFPLNNLLNSVKSSEHHHGRLNDSRWKPSVPPTIFENPEDSKESSSVQPHSPPVVGLRDLTALKQDSQSSLGSSMFGSSDLQSIYLPAYDPLREESVDDFGRQIQHSDLSTHLSDAPPSPGSSSSSSTQSWITDSDADSALIENYHDDDSNDISFSDDSRKVDSGWGGDCLHETEDIDFEFVYALHTFVATVEGQANATKGDTMVLLDDSNSYWWLVRVVKDNTIGYLPAEHIETPTERLARLNKHRNIDLSATMLQDTVEKSKNPLKKAMRRRNAKTVQFTEPTYVEASDYDFSSDDEDGSEELFGGSDPTNGQVQVQVDSKDDRSEPEQDDNLKVEPLKIGGAKKDSKAAVKEETVSEPTVEASNGKVKARSSEEILEGPHDAKISRNGTIRNTDSFFNDDNAETIKKILTPPMLRDDSSSSTISSRERGPSLESLEKNGFADKVKDDKKRKEKKPGMLSGLFKRKDKKTKGASALDSFDSDAEKVSEEFGRNSPQAKLSEDSSLERPSTEREAQSPQRQPSKGKLQKPARGRESSPSKNKGSGIENSEPTSVQTSVQNGRPKESSNGQPTGSQVAPTMRLVSAEANTNAQPIKNELNANAAAARPSQTDGSSGQTSTDKDGPQMVKAAKKRMQLDDFDSGDEQDDPFADPKHEDPEPQKPESAATGRLSESPVQISPTDARPPERQPGKDLESDSHQPPGLTGDTSSQETSSPISTPPREESPASGAPTRPNLSATHASGTPSPTSPITASTPPPSRPAPVPAKIDTSPPDSSSSSLPPWSDASLRSYLDDGSDIRDMLVVITDTSGVVPVGPDHPIMAGLFVEERKTMAQLNGQLDGLLGEWLERKRKKHGDSPQVPR